MVGDRVYDVDRRRGRPRRDERRHLPRAARRLDARARPGRLPAGQGLRRRAHAAGDLLARPPRLRRARCWPRRRRASRTATCTWTGAACSTGGFAKDTPYPDFAILLDRRRFDNILLRNAHRAPAPSSRAAGRCATSSSSGDCARVIAERRWAPGRVPRPDRDRRRRRQLRRLAPPREHAEGRRHGRLAARLLRGRRAARVAPIKVYFDRGFFPGYGWLFVDDDGFANVGLGYAYDKSFPLRANLRETFLAVRRARPRAACCGSPNQCGRISGGAAAFYRPKRDLRRSRPAGRRRREPGRSAERRRHPQGDGGGRAGRARRSPSRSRRATARSGTLAALRAPVAGELRDRLEDGGVLPRGREEPGPARFLPLPADADRLADDTRTAASRSSQAASSAGRSRRARACRRSRSTRRSRRAPRPGWRSCSRTDEESRPAPRGSRAARSGASRRPPRAWRATRLRNLDWGLEVAREGGPAGRARRGRADPTRSAGPARRRGCRRKERREAMSKITDSTRKAVNHAAQELIDNKVTTKLRTRPPTSCRPRSRSSRTSLGSCATQTKKQSRDAVDREQLIAHACAIAITAGTTARPSTPTPTGVRLPVRSDGEPVRALRRVGRCRRPGARRRREARTLSLEYLVDDGAVVAVDQGDDGPAGSTSTWEETSPATGFQVKSDFMTVQPGTKVTLDATRGSGAPALVRDVLLLSHEAGEMHASTCETHLHRLPGRAPYGGQATARQRRRLLRRLLPPARRPAAAAAASAGRSRGSSWSSRPAGAPI